MKIKDYIFYRMYWAYKKANEFGRFSAVLYLSFIDYFLITPFILIIGIIYDGIMHEKAPKIFFFIPSIIIYILNHIRYFKKDKIKELNRKYENNKYNKLVKNWMLYCIPFIIAMWGLFGIVPILKILQFIISLFKG